MAKFNFHLGMQFCSPLDHSSVCWPRGSTFKISPLWYWSLITHYCVFSPSKPESPVPIRQRLHFYEFIIQNLMSITLIESLFPSETPKPGLHCLQTSQFSYLPNSLKNPLSSKYSNPFLSHSSQILPQPFSKATHSDPSQQEPILWQQFLF